MGACLVPLLWLDPLEHLTIWIILLMAHAFFAATQDVAIDALAVTTTAPEQRGWLNGAMQAGMLLGRSLFGGGAILIAHRFGWQHLFMEYWRDDCRYYCISSYKYNLHCYSDFGRRLYSYYQ